MVGKYVYNQLQINACPSLMKKFLKVILFDKSVLMPIQNIKESIILSCIIVVCGSYHKCTKLHLRVSKIIHTKIVFQIVNLWDNFYLGVLELLYGGYGKIWGEYGIDQALLRWKRVIITY